jgi:hypothetical protein
MHHVVVRLLRVKFPCFTGSKNESVTHMLVASAFGAQDHLLVAFEIIYHMCWFYSHTRKLGAAPRRALSY